jgi:hypothetical protein
MSSVAERREMKPSTDCVGVKSVWYATGVVNATGGLTLGLGTRKSERRAMMGGRLCTEERQPIRYVDVDVERSGRV